MEAYQLISEEPSRGADEDAMMLPPLLLSPPIALLVTLLVVADMNSFDASSAEHY